MCNYELQSSFYKDPNFSSTEELGNTRITYEFWRVCYRSVNYLKKKLIFIEKVSWA
jgi:hypothetical protein